MSRPIFHEYAPGAVIRHGERTYVIEQKISNGKFGHTFACVDDSRCPRLMQVLWPFSRGYESVRESWLHQTSELQRLEHPGFVALVDAFEVNRCFHLVQERCEDRLDRAIAGPEWDGGRWLKVVARPVLCALEHLHRNGYFHANLHPHNILCTAHLEGGSPGKLSYGVLKIADLVVNMLLGKVDLLNTKVSRSLVPPEYLCPSLCGPLDRRVDIYQAGLLLLCVLEGRILRYSFQEISTGRPAQQAGSLATACGEILARALQPRVTDRFDSALDLWRALDGPCSSFDDAIPGTAELTC
jgi:serine/threonine protein kinase